MNRNPPVVTEILNRCKDDLIDVGVLLERADPGGIEELVPGMDLKLRSAYQVADACRRLDVLLRPPNLDEYDPPGVLRRLSAQQPAAVDAAKIHVEQMERCIGDADQIFECVRLTCRNFQVVENGRLRVTATARGGAPRITFTLEGGGTPPAIFDLEGVYLFDLDELRGRWYSATHGGVVDRTPGGLAFCLEGDVDTPVPEPSHDTGRGAALISLARRLRPWRGAIGDYEPGCAGAEEVIQLYRKTVAAALEETSRAMGLSGAASASA